MKFQCPWTLFWLSQNSQVLKPFGNSLLMIAAMTYAKNNADISTMASLEVEPYLEIEIILTKNCEVGVHYMILFVTGSNGSALLWSGESPWKPGGWVGY